MVKIFCPANLLVRSRFSTSSKAKKGLKCRGWRFAPVVPKDEFVEVDLELRLAHSVIGADKPLLEVSNSAIREWD